MDSYDNLRLRLATALEAAATAHEEGDLSAIGSGYDELDGLSSYPDDPRVSRLRFAVEFWDCWIDARNHQWWYYDLRPEEWPRYARSIAADLRSDHDAIDPAVVQNFGFLRNRRPSWWSRLKDAFRAGAV